MKRKTSDTDAPLPQAESSIVDSAITFTSLDLDARLQQAVAKLGFHHPTLVQSKAIPLALEGKDILARAKTGSGKTAAYLLPILQTILTAKSAPGAEEKKNVTRALILVPTKELAEQVTKMTDRLAEFCKKLVKTVNIAQNVGEGVQRSVLAENPDIVVATPSRAMMHLGHASGATLARGIEKLVIDEADLVLSYGYEDDLQGIAKALPKGLQTFLMSATLTKEVDTLKGLFCRSPAILRLEEDADASEGGIEQFVVKYVSPPRHAITTTDI